MWINKHRGFSVIEIIIVLGVVSLLLAVSAPIFTKKMRNSQNTGCSGGLRAVKKVFTTDANYTIPENIIGDVTVTMVGGGGGGAEGIASVTTAMKPGTYTRGQSSCSLFINEKYANNISYIRNIRFVGVTPGESVTCDDSRAGNSGTVYMDTNIPLKRGYKLTYNYNNLSNEWYRTLEEKDEERSTPTITHYKAAENDYLDGRNFDIVNPVLGEVGSGGSPAFLQGGRIPNMVMIQYKASLAGVGQSCKWNSHNNKYETAGGATSFSCQLDYRYATPGSGGGAGAYAKFDVSMAKKTECTITIGKGGPPHENGKATSLRCNGTTYSVGGGSAPGYQSASGGSGGSTYVNIPETNRFNGQQGFGPSGGDVISGGSGGSVYSYVENDNYNLPESKVFTQGADGGCLNAKFASECENPNGVDAIMTSADYSRGGAGGGGGSCSESGCGRGGRGGDGVVILEYKTKCY